MIYCLLHKGQITDKLREFDTPPVLSAEKEMVWVPYTKQSAPAYDPTTHKLSPWSRAIVDGSVIESCTTIALTDQELANNKLAWLAESDRKDTGRMIEDLLVAVATGQPLARDIFPAAVWSKLNARRAKRGLAPV